MPNNDLNLLTQAFIGFLFALTALLYMVTEILKAWQRRREMERLVASQQATILQVERVNRNVNQSSASVQGKLDDVHGLLNGGMAAQLLLHKTTARRLAEKTGEAADLAVAQVADEAYAKHLEKQEAAKAAQTKGGL